MANTRILLLGAGLGLVVWLFSGVIAPIAGSLEQSKEPRVVRLITVAPAGPNPQERLALHIAKRFGKREELASQLVLTAYLYAQVHNLSPFTVLAVIEQESGFRAKAVGAITSTDRGYMQVNAKWHADKVAAAGGTAALFDMETNIRLGTQILAEYRLRSNTEWEMLRRYNGLGKDNHYPDEVLAKKAHYQRIAES